MNSVINHHMEIKLLILLVYFGILFYIGWWSSKKIKDIKDYYVGGKKLGYWVVAFSTRATGESAWLLLGLTGLGAIAGISAFWVVLGEVLGVSIAWMFMAKKFKRITDQFQSITIPHPPLPPPPVLGASTSHIYRSISRRNKFNF